MSLADPVLRQGLASLAPRIDSTSGVPPAVLPVSAEYDGDGTADVGGFRPSDGTWYLLRSALGPLTQPFGASGDLPIPLFFIRHLSSGAGRVPGDLPFESKVTVVRSGNDIRLTWNGSRALSDTDFAVYQGTLGSFTSHTPVLCSTSGATTVTFAPAAGNCFYLVVAHNGSVDGSYGLHLDSRATATVCRSLPCAGHHKLPVG